MTSAEVKRVKRFVVEYTRGYVAGENATQIGRRLGIKPGYVSMTASTLRKRYGVKIPKLSDRLRVEDLNALIERELKVCR